MPVVVYFYTHRGTSSVVMALLSATFGRTWALSLPAGPGKTLKSSRSLHHGCS